MEVFGIDRFSLRHPMDYLGHQVENLDAPIITARVVSRTTQRCWKGLEADVGVKDDAAKRNNLCWHWSDAEVEPAPLEPEAKLEVRAARFASVEVPPAQAAFWRPVCMKYEGSCAISARDVDRALEVEHLRGRSWRAGHNC